eukprot:Gb_32526 [translate_table: standard]
MRTDVIASQARLWSQHLPVTRCSVFNPNDSIVHNAFSAFTRSVETDPGDSSDCGLISIFPHASSSIIHALYALRFFEPFPFNLYGLLEQCLPFYYTLKRHALRPAAFGISSSALTVPALPVPVNKQLLVWVGDELVPRENAKVSVFDSIVQGGDGVWEGLRIYDGKIFKLEEHLDRLFDSAKAMAFINVTSGMSPAFNMYGCTLIVLAEWKPPVYDNAGGISLITASTRRNSPNVSFVLD